MSLTTHSAFYFGHFADGTNNAIDFDEGGPELQATIVTGSYTLSEYAAAVQNAMNAIGGQTYTVIPNRTTRLLTISAAGIFALLTNTGTRSGVGAWVLMGYATGADKTAANSYLGDSASGSSYTTQFILQSHVPSDNFQKAADAVVNKTASGRVEVVKFGQEKFIEANFDWITDATMIATAPIRNRASGVADFRAFIQAITTKEPFEYMQDEDTPSTFEKVILEKTQASGDGVGYKLKEKRGLPGFFESGVVTFRVIL